MASAPGNANYEAATVSKVLTVRGLSQTMTFNAISNKKLTDVDFDPGATVSTGLPIVYTSSNLAVANNCWKQGSYCRCRHNYNYSNPSW